SSGHPKPAEENRSVGLMHLVARAKIVTLLELQPGQMHLRDPTVSPIVDGKHLVAVGLGLPERDELGQLLRAVAGQIMTLGEVVLDVKQMPLILSEHMAAFDELPLCCRELI